MLKDLTCNIEIDESASGGRTSTSAFECLCRATDAEGFNSSLCEIKHSQSWLIHKERNLVKHFPKTSPKVEVFFKHSFLCFGNEGFGSHSS